MAASPLSLLTRLSGAIARNFHRSEPQVSPETIAKQLDQLNEVFNQKVDALVNGMKSGTITIAQFTGSMPSLIRQHHLAAAVIAEGGSHLATPDTLAIAQQASTEQLQYFDRWQKQLLQQADKGELPSWEYISNRAKMYAKASTETASRTYTQSFGVPELPFYPASQTECHSFCKCRWVIETLDVVNGNFDCYYEVDEHAEHCVTCIVRALAANPLEVRHGVILNPEKYQDARMYV